jgi:hypothetical protein
MGFDLISMAVIQIQTPQGRGKVSDLLLFLLFCKLAIPLSLF